MGYKFRKTDRYIKRKPTLDIIIDFGNMKSFICGNFMDIGSFNIPKDHITQIYGGSLYEYIGDNSNLEKIFNFYQILNKITEPDNIGILEELAKEKPVIEFDGDDMQCDYFHIANVWGYDYSEGNIDRDFVYFHYSLSPTFHPQLTPDGKDQEWKITYPEFYMLMQIFFGVYQEEAYYRELLDNEKNGKYSEIENIQWKNRGKYDEKLLEEFFILQLMKKDISGAFGPIYEKDENGENTEKILFEGIKVQKIFDKNWPEEKQQKAANEINELFGDEVVIMEE